MKLPQLKTAPGGRGVSNALFERLRCGKRSLPSGARISKTLAKINLALHQDLTKAKSVFPLNLFLAAVRCAIIRQEKKHFTANNGEDRTLHKEQEDLKAGAQDPNSLCD